MSRFESVVLGGGAAGLSAALTLGRGRREVLMVDNGRQSNLAATTVGGLPGHEGGTPAEYYATARAELTAFPTVELRDGEIAAARRAEDGFTVVLADGPEVHARTLILAPGVDYDYPRLPGLEDRWGNAVFHCPFCHGWEVRDRPLAVLAAGEVGVHGALNLRGWSDRITLLTNGDDSLTDDHRKILADGGVTLDERPVAKVTGTGPQLQAVHFADGGEIPAEGLLVKSILRQRSTLARDLGATVLEPDEHLSVEAIQVDRMGATGMPGLFAAGDAATSVPPSLSSALASGYLVGAAAVVGLNTGR
ncbi:pyridine nucleotide-disulfide oxidoreductase [Streptomonospora alba]|uniref:Pyridine nucleotide-disulfide oxidoreductase n=1 Tax=Streptomonospora alba TaxID=183763 RepID=A0A0C2FJV2_9ACTN|nr:NAD(P)/FAD-dependent oxidoreductase [Streptomonospora alba]KIH99604.1 pyridine nucleotide-disulfide oxidoreductase [Streptomonospora alba]